MGWCPTLVFPDSLCRAPPSYLRLAGRAVPTATAAHPGGWCPTMLFPDSLCRAPPSYLRLASPRSRGQCRVCRARWSGADNATRCPHPHHRPLGQPSGLRPTACPRQCEQRLRLRSAPSPPLLTLPTAATTTITMIASRPKHRAHATSGEAIRREKVIDARQLCRPPLLRTPANRFRRPPAATSSASKLRHQA